jgi:hypothetical protein
MQSLPAEYGGGGGAVRRSLRPIAFAAVTFASVTMFACVIVVPLAYNHMRTSQAYMSAEVEFCKVTCDLECYR